MSSWLKSIRNGASHIKSVDDFNFKVDGIKNASSGVQSIDDTFKNLDYIQKGDEMYINTGRIRDLEKDFRVGNISKGLEKADVVSTIPASSESLFRTTIEKEAPDLDVLDLDAKVTSAKKFHSDLDVTSTSGADLEGKLSTMSKEKAKSMWAKIVKVVGVGGVAAGVFTAVILTNNVFEDIHKAADARNGCFLIYKNTNTQACKIVSKSCGYGTASAASAQTCDSTMTNTLSYNIYVMVLHYVTTSDTTNIDALKAKGCQWPDGATVDQVLGVEANIPILVQHYTDTYPTFTSVPFVACDMMPNYEGCVACDPTQPTISRNFTSTETLDGNMNYKCITNTTAIEAVTDIATSLGIDIFSASGDSLSGSLQGNFFMVVIIILALIAFIAIIIKLVPKKDKPTSQQQQSSQPQQQQQSGNSNPTSFGSSGGDGRRADRMEIR